MEARSFFGGEGGESGVPRCEDAVQWRVEGEISKRKRAEARAGMHAPAGRRRARADGARPVGMVGNSEEGEREREINLLLFRTPGNTSQKTRRRRRSGVRDRSVGVRDVEHCALSFRRMPEATPNNPDSNLMTISRHLSLTTKLSFRYTDLVAKD